MTTVKKIAPVLAAASLGLAGLFATQTALAAFPDKPINVIVAYSAGGGTDTTARTLAPFLEKVLKVPVNVVNRPGGSGWVGWVGLANAKPDGYTIGYLNSPNIASGLVNPAMERPVKLDDFVAIGNQVSDPGAIVIRKDEKRFSNFKELVEYAKTHELTTTATGVGGDDHLVTLKLNKELGTQFRAIQFEGTADSRTAFLGGHVDILMTSVGEVYTLNDNGQVNVVAVTARKRSPFMKDVPTVQDVTSKTVISASTRGLVAPKAISADNLKTLRDAMQTAVNDPDYQAKMKSLGIGADYMAGPEYMSALKKDVEDIKGVSDLIGW
ncbi:Bug family tripartite tricarboxylate transporter substrate binding protein [Castellaniella sp.]|uniref:Bug family tripartite tricarboxylate transporter substrate binding protein n=1 Tax=Castellaniella sp. TaxID=1955812 RepID=UPI003A9403B0